MAGETEDKLDFDLTGTQVQSAHRMLQRQDSTPVGGQKSFQLGRALNKENTGAMRSEPRPLKVTKHASVTRKPVENEAPDFSGLVTGSSIQSHGN